jgi:hypothetical protein
MKRLKAISDKGDAWWYDAVNEGIAFYVGTSEHESGKMEIAIAVHAPGKDVILF